MRNIWGLHKRPNSSFAENFPKKALVHYKHTCISLSRGVQDCLKNLIEWWTISDTGGWRRIYRGCRIAANKNEVSYKIEKWRHSGERAGLESKSPERPQARHWSGEAHQDDDQFKVPGRWRSTFSEHRETLYGIEGCTNRSVHCTTYREGPRTRFWENSDR